MKMIKKLFKNDFRTAFVFGMVQYTAVNLVSGSDVETTWYIRLTAHAISAIVSITIIFVYIKVMRKILKNI
ncbi:hypothetical protein CN984_11970 [Bacillus cereus]|uniref:Uncharacterized protein n=1 Tax=Bacillus cereus TaxID=1396 RepID=A0A2B9Q2R2_BACCE|nr:hypothetical protein CON44_18125 [Bacillus cereus]PGO29158.1 hypothetical protein CN984_11970 [Bacillus cereus]